MFAQLGSQFLEVQEDFVRTFSNTSHSLNRLSDS